MHNVALFVLMAGAENYLLFQHIPADGKAVLKLIAEAVSAAVLIKARPCRNSRNDALIIKPVVDRRIKNRF